MYVFNTIIENSEGLQIWSMVVSLLYLMECGVALCGLNFRAVCLKLAIQQPCRAFVVVPLLSKKTKIYGTEF